MFVVRYFFFAYVSGKKDDSYIIINRLTGEKQLVLSMQNIFSSCQPDKSDHGASKRQLFLGRTMYNVMLYEQETGHNWNVTFHDYTTHGNIHEEDYGKGVAYVMHSY